jgi:predicted hydrolase (HD superfamily)
MSDLDRFQLFVIVRNQVSDRDILRRYLAVEAAMEELAPALDGIDVGHARLLGLGACIDAQLCRANPERRGEVAKEILDTEGAPPEVCSAVLACRRDEPEVMTSLAALLLTAEAVVGEIYDVMEVDEAGLDDLESELLAMRIERRAVRRGDEEAKRVLKVLERLGITLERAAVATLAAMRRVREDLRL